MSRDNARLAPSVALPRPPLLYPAAGAALFIALITVGAVSLPPYWLFLGGAAAVGSLLALGLGVVALRAGRMSLCQLSCAAVGGWVASWLSLEMPQLPYPLVLAAAGAAALALGWGLGWVTQRVRGVEFAVLTLCLAAVVDVLLRQSNFPGVGSGTPVVPNPPFGSPLGQYLLAWGAFAVAAAALLWIERTPHGVAWSMIRESERGAAALGVPVGRVKASAFAAASLCAGVAGGLLAAQYGLLVHTAFSPLSSLIAFATAVMCGASLVSGAVLAGVLGVGLPELLRRIGLPLDLAQALFAVGAWDVLRRGSGRGRGGIAERLWHWVQDRTYRGRDLRSQLSVRSDSVAPPTTDIAPTPGAAPPAPRSHTEPPSHAPVLPEPSPSPSLSPSPGMPEHPAATLRLSGVSVIKGSTAILDGVTLTLNAGSVHAVIGPNGAGKTTLIDAVSGFEPEHTGEIVCTGSVRRTFQQLIMPEDLTVGQYLTLAVGYQHRGHRGAHQAASRHRLAQLNADLGLPQSTVPIRLLDSAARRCLEIAGALSANPTVLLLDEPAAGLDERESEQLAEWVRDLPQRYGCAVLLVEHDVRFVRTAATVLTVLNRGAVIASGPVEATLRDPLVQRVYSGRSESVAAADAESDADAVADAVGVNRDHNRTGADHAPGA